MTREQAKKLAELRKWYRGARSQVARQVAAGVILDLAGSVRWDLVNAQHALAEFVESLPSEGERHG